jgi:mono/diheme cytochrome c family protein
LTKRIVRASIVLGLAVTGGFVTRSGAQGVQEAISFTKDIQPILQNSCWKCHGEAMQLSKLDLRTREAALKGGEKGAAIIPGNSGESRLYRRVAGLEKPAMPMDGTLGGEQVAAIKTWIDQGAHWDAEVEAKAPAVDRAALLALENMEIPPEARNYWAFKLPVQVPPPNVSTNLTNPIDRFLEKARQEKGLRAAPRADRLTLLRRAYLDLIGLPPTPAEAAQFMADDAPGAWERLIDRLLASPHYGERWGRHWLDVARYADSDGFEHDYDRPNAWMYRDYVVRSFNEDKPYNLFIKEQIAGDELENKSDDTMIATGFLRAGPRVHFREKDTPERRFDYLDDVLATIGRGVLGLTVQCARCHNHKFDPIPQKDYYALQAAIFGYVETTYPLVPKEEADAYAKRVAEIDAQIKPLREQIAKIEEPYREKLKAEALKKFPENVQRAVAKSANERTPGEALLATQILEGALNVSGREVERALTSEEAVQRKALSDRIAALQSEKPKPIPVADIVTDGDYRFAPLGDGDDVIGCVKCRIQEGQGSFLHQGPGRYEVPPSYFLVRGDPNSKGSLMKPGFVTVATYGNPPTEIRPADGHTSGRRRALAEWLASRENPLTPRVIVNRIWHHHFGRGIVPTLDNFGKMGDPPTHPELLDWLAVEFINRGWSIKQIHRLIMTSQAYQMASAYDDSKNIDKDPQNQFLWRFRTQRLDAEIVRDGVLAASGALNLAVGGKPVRPPLPDALVKSTIYNVWKNQEDGPEVWRRSLYVYRKRGMAFPMFEVFDMPDPNFSAGRRSVSTVPTQALTLINNEFVLKQAQMFADRVKKEAGDDPVQQIQLAYRIALTRPPDDTELAVATDLVGSHSLVDLTHVLLNLSEFLYMR